jgi:hypothetical protein
MARKTAGRLTPLKVTRAVEKPGMHADGGGLYLQVRPGGASRILRYGLAGRTRYMGLGPLTLYGLADARTRAVDARRLRHEGIDPTDARKTARVRAALDAAKVITFKAAAEKYIATSIGPLVDPAGGVAL